VNYLSLYNLLKIKWHNFQYSGYDRLELEVTIMIYRDIIQHRIGKETWEKQKLQIISNFGKNSCQISEPQTQMYLT
jgi:hypothetical protein